MATYTPPVRDMQFVLHELLNVEQGFSELDGFGEADRDIIDAVLEEGGKVCAEAVFPTLHTGDAEGCRLEDGNVSTPSGFKDAYQTLVDGGWLALGAEPEFGGQGLPHTLSVCFEEFLQSSNMALSLYPGLSRGAYIAMKHHASDELKHTFLPKIVSGEWTGVMCLTEPHCGTDLGLMRTRAEPADDGAYRVSGTKIFITGGDQDLTENIIHLVLARLPDAPKGVKGISLFVVPKYLVNADGSLGMRNGFSVGSIEKKMGIKGASTCVMNYDGAVGYIVGEPHRGLQAMFSMMNHERLMVGQQGLSIAEVAYQSAAAYAKDRLQGRSLTGPKAPDKNADPIIVHPDIRRMLLGARAHNESARALFTWVSLQIDIAERHPDAERRQQADDLVMLLTPVIKAYFTDYGFESSVECQQVLGGHGYIAEWGMEQLVRDARIAQIYEGANGIHALDLVGRKLPMHGGRLVESYLKVVQDWLDENADDPALEEFNAPVREALAQLRESTAWITEAAKANPDEIGASAYDYLRLMALTAMGHMWARSAKVALPNIDGDNTGFYKAKVDTARYFMRRVMPKTQALGVTLAAGADSLMAMEADAF